MSQASAVQRLIALRAGRTSARKPSELLVSVSRYFSLVNRHKASPTPESADLIEGIRQQLTREYATGRFRGDRDALKREVERRVTERMLLSRGNNYTRLAPYPDPV